MYLFLISHFHCAERLFCSHLQCSGVVTVRDSSTHWCCMVHEPEIQYRKPGDLILYYKSDTPVKCQTGWAGRNCAVCALGWAGENCDVCDFGFSTESNCTECIQNGHWTGTHGSVIIFLTFDEPACTVLVPGKLILDNSQLYSQQVSHQRWIWEVNCMHVTKHTSEGSTLALKPRGDVHKSKTGYQWPNEKDLCLPKNFKKRNSLPVFKIRTNLFTTKVSCYGHNAEKIPGKITSEL